MPEESAGRPEVGSSRGSADELDARVEEFEEAWAAGRRPAIGEHLAGTDFGRSLLVELIHADLHFRHRAGEEPRVEDYLAAYPDLAADPAALVELARAEQRLRSRPPRPGDARGGIDPATPAVAPSAADTGLEADAASTAAWPARPAGVPDKVGRFRPERVLGRGGFGTVYFATDPDLGRPVAVKVPHPHVLADPTLRARFLKEARAAAALEHPNLVPVHEAGETDGVCYLVSAYCPGENLAQWLEGRTEPVAAAGAAEVVAALADAVAYSHGRGVLHRDLKPANVMLVSRGEGGPDGDRLPFTPRLTDFGMAKVVEASLAETRTSVMMGTPLYMSPEQVDGTSSVGPAADVYGLGVILYELLAGRPPFDGPLATLLARVRSESPPPPSACRAAVPRDLETVCLKCLEKDPADRYYSAAALADDLRAFLDGRAIRATRTGLLRKASLWARRPERLRDAGVYAMLLNALIVLWMTFNCFLVGVGVHELAKMQLIISRFDDVAAIRDSAFVAATTHLPLIAIGWHTLRRRKWAVRAGTGLSLLLVVVLFGSWVNLVPTFGGLYEDPRVRATVYSMLFLLFAAQLAAFAAAEFALRRR